MYNHKYLIMIIAGTLLFTQGFTFHKKTSIKKSQSDAKIIKNPKSGLWDEGGKRGIALNQSLTIYDESDENKMFYYINGLQVDADKNIYITQHKTFSIFKFDQNGEFIRRFGREGQGPGEFMCDPLCVIHGDSLHVYDSILKKFSVFLLNGNYVRSYKIKSQISTNPPWGYALDEDNNWYLSYYNFKNNKVLHSYDNQGRHIQSFGKPPDLKITPEEMAYSLLKITGKGQIFINENTIFYSQSTPYEIRLYNRDTKLKAIIFKENDLKPGRVDKKGEDSFTLILPSSSCMIRCWNNMIINASVRLSPYLNEYNSYLDFFDMSGVLLTSLQFKETIFFKYIDQDGNIYGNYRNDSSERIVRYSIEILN